MAKTLVVFYSLNGHARAIGNKIAQNLKADVEEIKDIRDRSHIVSWQTSAFDEELRTDTKIQKNSKNPLDYDLVVIGTPIWDGIVPPVRAYLKQNKFRKVAFFSTFGAAAEEAFYVMEKLSGNKPVAVLEVQDRQAYGEDGERKITEFCKKIK